MRVLLTGGYGCIGSWVIRKLLDRGHETVWVYDLVEDQRRLRLVLDKDELPAVHYVPGDVTDVDRLVEALETHEITHLLHLAALQVPFCRAEPIRGGRVNVLGTLAVFEAVKRLRPQIGQVVYASSVAVYGPQELYDARPVPEDVPLLPATLYGGYKVCNELNARVYWLDDGIPSATLRPWTVYGVGRDQGLTSAPTKAIKAAVVGRRYHMPYGGWQCMQYVEDVAELFVRLLETPLDGANVFNLRGSLVAADEFLNVLDEIVPGARRLITYDDVQLGIAYDLSDERLRTALPDFTYTPLTEGIRRTAERFRMLYQRGMLSLEDLES